MPLSEEGLSGPPAQPDGGPTKVPVQFVVPEYLTHWGQVLKVVGSLDELGNWKVEQVGAAVAAAAAATTKLAVASIPVSYNNSTVAADSEG